MPRYSPIKFKEPPLSAKAKEYLTCFINKHPVAASTTKALFALAIFGGILTAASVAPNVIGAWGYGAAAREREQKNRYNKLRQSFYQLKKERAIVYKGEKEGVEIYEFTKKGRKKIRTFILDSLEIPAPAKWDGKWRVIIFDIPEKYRNARVALSKKLLDMGCYQLQKSVWVYPFPCEEEIEFLKETFEIKPFVNILIATEIDKPEVLEYFGELLGDFV